MKQPQELSSSDSSRSDKVGPVCPCYSSVQVIYISVTNFSHKIKLIYMKT